MAFLFYYCYLTILLLAVITGLVRKNGLQKHIHSIIFLLGLYLLNEVSDYILNILRKSYTYVDSLFGIIEIIFISSYFLAQWQVKKKKFLLFLIAVLSTTIAFTSSNIEVIGSYTNYQLLFNSFLTATMALYSLYRIMINTGITRILYYPDFLITAAFLLLSCGEYLFWGIGLILVYVNYPFRESIHIYHISLNLCCILLMIYAFLCLSVTNETNQNED